MRYTEEVKAHLEAALAELSLPDEAVFTWENYEDDYDEQGDPFRNYRGHYYEVPEQMVEHALRRGENLELVIRIPLGYVHERKFQADREAAKAWDERRREEARLEAERQAALRELEARKAEELARLDAEFNERRAEIDSRY